MLPAEPGSQKQTRFVDLLLVYLLALAVNGLVAILVNVPGYPDADYYFNGALLVARGGPLVEPYFWNYAAAPAALPTPAFAYWQPLPSFIGALGIWAFGSQAAFGSAQAVFSLLGSAVPVLAYLVAAQLGERRHALLSGVLAAFSGFYAIYWSLPESFTPFALAGAGALLLAGIALRDGRARLWLAAGACAGLAHLARADGLLLIAVLVPVALSGAGRARGRLAHASLAVLGYLLVMAPWFARNLVMFGSIQAPGGLRALWLVDYNDLFTYPNSLSASSFFAAGWEAILRSKWQALTTNTATLIGALNLVILTPFFFIGAWGLRRSTFLRPFFAYSVLLFIAMTFGFSLVGARGGWMHSGSALFPWIVAVGVVGFDRAILWAASRRPDWDPPRAFRMFGALLVAVAAALTAYIVAGRVVGLPWRGVVAWNNSGSEFAEAGAYLDSLNLRRELMVMTNNPMGFYARTGRGGIPLANGGEEAVLRAARDYGVYYLVIDQNIPEGLRALYERGASSEAFILMKAFGDPANPTYLFFMPGDCNCNAPPQG